MRVVTWTEYAPVGDGSHELSEPLDQFLRSGASIHVVLFRVIPPLIVLNHLFHSGGSHRGMGGAWTWQPFEIAQEEYNEVVCLLTSAEAPEGYRKILAITEAPEWIQDENDFTAYLFQLPVERYLAIAHRRKELQEILGSASEDEQEQIEQGLEQVEFEESSLYPDKANMKLRIPPIRVGQR